MNLHAVRAIYRFEMARTRRTLMQSIVSPVLSTSLYFVVFGTAIGSRIQEVGGISYGSFIVPGLIMLSLLTQSISNASFGIYFPRFVGTICSFSNPSAQMPMMKPSRLKVAAVSTRNASIHSGWAIRNGTNRPDVARMISPRTIDLVAAAPT